MRGDLAQEVQSVGLVASFLVCAREFKGTSGTVGCLVRPTSQPLAFTEMDEPDGDASVTNCMVADCSTACSRSGRPSASRPVCAYASPKGEASLGKKRGICADWQRRKPRSSTGMAL